MAALIIRIPDGKRERLKDLARARGPRRGQDEARASVAGESRRRRQGAAPAGLKAWHPSR